VPSVACGIRSIRLIAVSAAWFLSAQDHSSQKMADGREWTTQNLNVTSVRSYCYEDSEQNCAKYGRLYTWESASKACPALGDRWRLPTEDEWRQMAKHFGGFHEDSEDGGKAAYHALLMGGGSGFGALLGGGRSEDGQYTRLGAHGFYWTASESDSARAYYYNFGRGSLTLYRQTDGEKVRAFSVRCVRD